MTPAPSEGPAGLDEINVVLSQDASDDAPDGTQDDASEDALGDVPGSKLYRELNSRSLRRSKNLFSSLRERANLMRHDSTDESTADEDSITADAWNRVRVDDDVEIHYRSTGDDEFLDKIKKLVALARKLLG